MGFADLKIVHPPKYLPVKEIFETRGMEFITLSAPEQPEPKVRNPEAPQEEQKYDIIVYCHELEKKYTLTAKNGGRSGLSEVCEHLQFIYVHKNHAMRLRATYLTTQKAYEYSSEVIELSDIDTESNSVAAAKPADNHRASKKYVWGE